MIIKARIKSFEDMPDKFKCCKATIKAMAPYHGREIELSGKTCDMYDICPWCGFEVKGLGMEYVQAGRQIFPECIDIDEGLVN